jgi:hypothetical protein
MHPRQREGAPMAQYMEGFAPNVTEKEVVSAVHKVEDRFVFEHDQSTTAADGRQEALRHIWKGTENFANNNPQAVASLVSDLERQDLLPQLAIAALDEAAGKQHAGHHRPFEFTKTEAIALIDRKDALGDAIRHHLDKSFVISPRSAYNPEGLSGTPGLGGGYADIEVPRATNTYDPVYKAAITDRHLDDLTRNFSHLGKYLSTEMQAEEDQKSSRWLPLLSWLSK